MYNVLHATQPRAVTLPQMALKDAAKAVSLRPDWAKAYSRQVGGRGMGPGRGCGQGFVGSQGRSGGGWRQGCWVYGATGLQQAGLTP